jgi:hypothetical protein
MVSGFPLMSSSDGILSVSAFRTNRRTMATSSKYFLIRSSISGQMFPAGPISACTGRKILIRRAETLDNAQELSNRDENPPVLRCGLKLSSLTTLMPNPQDLWPASRMVSSLSRKLSNRCSNSETNHFSSLRFSKKQGCQRSFCNAARVVRSPPSYPLETEIWRMKARRHGVQP